MSKPKIINRQKYLEAYKCSSSKKEMNEYLNSIGVNSSIYIINRFLKEENLPCPVLKQTVLDQALKSILKDNLYNAYIVQNWSVQECSDYFKVAKGTIRDLLKYYNIKKSKEQYYAKSFKTRNEHFSKDEINTKRTKTMLERYGVENGSQIKGADDKRKQTFINHYGSLENYKKQTTSKINQTIIEKYGSLNNFYVERNETIKQANITKYGVENISQQAGWYDKVKSNVITKYGSLQAYNDYIGLQKLKDKATPEFTELYLDKDKLIAYLESNPGISYSKLAENLNVDVKLTYILINKFNLHSYMGTTGCRSLPEIDIAKELIESSDINIVRDSRSILPSGKELDFYLPNYNIGIEFNGTYWHSSLIKDKNYHYSKSIEASSKNIHLIHIWEYEWKNPTQKNKIRSLFNIILNRNINKIYARNCTIKEITNKEAKSFNEANHLQGHRNAKITYGLFYKNELVQIMSFSHHKKYEWEMIRECTKLNTQVVGGCSKLFKHFLRKYNPDHVFSYCDFNKFNGKSYELLGFKFVGYTGPDMKWVLNINKGIIVDRQSKNNPNLKEIAEAQLFGAGNKKYLWSK